MHIVDMVYFWARTMPQRPAVIQPQGIVTYRALAQAIESAAEHFARNIADKSKPVAVSVSTGPKMLVASLGLLRAGFDVIPASPSMFEQLPAAGTDTLVYERDGSTLDGGTNILFDENWLTIGPNSRKKDIAIRRMMSKGGHIIYFTSGSTGRPKKVAQTLADWEQRMLFPNNSAFVDYERALIVPGLASSYGINRAYETLYAGKSACFAPFGERMLWLVNTYGIDTIIASTQQALQLADLQDKSIRYALPSLKTVRVGGSIMTRDGFLRIKNNLCRDVIVFYASAEAGPVASAPYDMIADIPNAVGFVAPGVEVEIVDEAGHVMPVDTEGFVRVRTPVLLARSRADQTDMNWFYPGDLGWLTEEGALCIAGRTGDVVNRGGVKLSVADFENFLLSCPGVKDAGICTHRGTTGYEEVWIGIVLEPAADIAMLRQSIESNAVFGANFDKLFVVEALPRGTLGKIQRNELRQMLQDISEQSTLPG